MWPIALNWKRAHVTVDNTRVVLAEFADDQFAVLIFDPSDNLHQLPITKTEAQSELLFHEMVKAIHQAS